MREAASRRVWGRALTIALASAACLTAACGEVTAPSICEIGGGDLVVYPPHGASNVPTNAVVRLLAGGRADDLVMHLVDQVADAEEPAVQVLFDTTFGDLLELTPDFELVGRTSYRVDVVDRFGDVVTSSVFTTGRDDEAGPAGFVGDAIIAPVAATERMCCTGAGCSEGTRITLPPLTQDNFTPQLVLVTVAEVFNDACGATSRPIGALPVVWDDSGAGALVAETDLILEGCFKLTAVTQTLRRSSPDDILCTDGGSFVPAGRTADCDGRTQPAGCSCGATDQNPGPLPGAAGIGLGLLMWLAWRRRRTQTA